jgi:hypothetical protein
MASFRLSLTLVDRETMVPVARCCCGGGVFGEFAAAIHQVAWVLCDYKDESPSRLGGANGGGACGCRSPLWRRR